MSSIPEMPSKKEIKSNPYLDEQVMKNSKSLMGGHGLNQLKLGGLDMAGNLLGHFGREAMSHGLGAMMGGGPMGIPAPDYDPHQDEWDQNTETFLQHGLHPFFGTKKRDHWPYKF